MKTINNTIKNTNNNINETNMAYRFNIIKIIKNIRYEEIKKLINKTNNYGTNR